jgi:hypothetical protein
MSASNQTVPNFFIADAPKAGMTTLYHWLAAYPQVYMSPIKKPSYFSLEARPENFDLEYRESMRLQMAHVKCLLHSGLVQSQIHGVVAEWEDYLRLFAGVKNETAVGKDSAPYLWSGTAAQGIAKRLPHARILVVLRDSAERAFSRYLHYISLDHVGTSFRQHLLDCPNPEENLNRFHLSSKWAFITNNCSVISQSSPGIKLVFGSMKTRLHSRRYFIGK